MKRKIIITVKGRSASWSFEFVGEPAHLAEWRQDGLEVYEVANAVPQWVQSMKLTRIWCLVQDAWRFLRLW